MKQLLINAMEFLDSAEDSFKKRRFNASASDFFKTIVVFCDYLVYKEIKRLPKNHADRFNLLEIYFKDIHKNVKLLFKIYTGSYNLRSTKEDVIKLRDYANELNDIVFNKKRS
jgi:uncharacterized protein (UPF0332 family)